MCVLHIFRIQSYIKGNFHRMERNHRRGGGRGFFWLFSKNDLWCQERQEGSLGERGGWEHWVSSSKRSALAPKAGGRNGNTEHSLPRRSLHSSQESGWASQRRARLPLPDSQDGLWYFRPPQRDLRRFSLGGTNPNSDSSSVWERPLFGPLKGWCLCETTIYTQDGNPSREVGTSVLEGYRKA